MKTVLSLLCKLSNILTNSLDYISPLALLLVRFYLFKIFFWSGWQKFSGWESTLMLFKYEYNVVGVSPECAAFCGTWGELILSLLFVLGLGARVPALGLLILNGISIIFYPLLLKPEYFCSLKDHILWGALCFWVLFQGHGKISLDYLIQKKLCKNYKL